MAHKQFYRVALFLLIVSLAGQAAGGGRFASAAPVFAPAAGVVISEIQVAGDGGANDEFVELYNPSHLPVNLDGWSLQYRGGGAGSFLVRNFSAAGNKIIPAHGFYLITGSAYNGATGSDFTFSVFSLSGIGGTIALVSDQTQLSTGSETSIVDKVAYGTGTLFPEGVAAPVPPSEQSIERNAVSGGGGARCDDTNNNFGDFAINATPNPQNISSAIAYCLIPTETPTPTETATPTETGTLTSSPTATATPTLSPTATATVVHAPLSLLINEVAWSGTLANTAHEWIELRNPGAQPINLAGWWLVSVGATPAINIALTGVIAPGGYFLLERTTDNTVSNIPADQIYTGALSNDGDTLRLIAPDGVTVVDTANLNPNNVIDRWPAGSVSPSFASMERAGILPDSDIAWFTHGGAPGPARDANNNLIRGTPRAANWAISVTSTPFPTRTPTRTPTPTRRASVVLTRTPTPIVEAVVINEFLPRAGADWNSDGETNLRDEYIELINIGPQPVNLNGWRLNHIFGLSVTYILPEVILLPDEKFVFFGGETGLNLSDGGGTVRLLKPNGVPFDAVTYGLVLAAERAWCRTPDGRGAWRADCDPSPRRANVPQAGERTPAPPVSALPQRPDYPLPESCPLGGAPAEIIHAECDSPGLGLANPQYAFKYSRP